MPHITDADRALARIVAEKLFNIVGQAVPSITVAPLLEAASACAAQAIASARAEGYRQGQEEIVKLLDENAMLQLKQAAQHYGLALPPWLAITEADK